MSLVREQYRQLCAVESTIPVFSQAWWLDAVAPENWDVVLCEKDGKIIASMPFIIKRKLFVSIVTMPVLTQHLGPWFRTAEDKEPEHGLRIVFGVARFVGVHLYAEFRKVEGLDELVIDPDGSPGTNSSMPCGM